MTNADAHRLRETLRETLLAHRAASGGWSYVAGKTPRIEPTCWALLALADSPQALDTGPLERWPRNDGWLVDVPGAPPNYAFNALAGLTLLAGPRTRAATAPLAGHIVAGRSIQIPQTDIVRLDASLRAWPWVDGTASWVEPTAWCLLFLKKRLVEDASDAVRARIDVGERMLADRVCRDGGWNYGNSEVYGRDLWPYVTTTAIALLALQDRRGEDYVQRSVEQLEHDVRSERSLLALSLTLLCLRIYGRPLEFVRGELVARGLDLAASGRLSENLLATAVAAYALGRMEGTPDAVTL